MSYTSANVDRNNTAPAHNARGTDRCHPPSGIQIKIDLQQNANSHVFTQT